MSGSLEMAQWVKGPSCASMRTRVQIPRTYAKSQVGYCCCNLAIVGVGRETKRSLGLGGHQSILRFSRDCLSGIRWCDRVRRPVSFTVFWCVQPLATQTIMYHMPHIHTKQKNKVSVIRRGFSVTMQCY